MNTALRRLLVLIPMNAVIGTLVLIIFVGMPMGTAEACLPCNCEELPTLNCFGPYAAYTRGDADACTIVIAAVNANGYDRDVFRITPREQLRLPDLEDLEAHFLVEEASGFQFYLLTSGEYQLNVGPDGEGKVHVLNFVGCPAEDVRESTFKVGE